MSDERPKPKYGELAPPGWTWQPPAPPANDSDVPATSGVGPYGAPGPAAGSPGTSGDSPSGPAAPYSAPPQPYAPPTGHSGAYPGTGQGTGTGTGPGTTAPKPINTVDVAVTGVLLFLGVLLSASMLPALFDFNTVLAQAAAAQGYTGFEASSSSSTAGIIAAVVTIVLQLLAIVIGVRRLQRRKLAFPFVLGLGILTFAVWIAAIVFAFFSDPAFLQQVMSTKAP
ncbi:DUF6264 family protein [Subtercola endophyticus]|uniref:DUF6264 family protein n=1 Tax=Subtercola endophyticus TaxID=2895559 RepID=UPI001E629094|nr:DUF6264 family protein [Subtercola endophyticus]UFS59876.1 DUF6264 family protein [Subtercola endophyticus]